MTFRADELEEVPCDLCGGATTRFVVTRPDGMRVVECPSCGLAFLSPRPRPELISRLYQRGYFTGGSDGMGYQKYAQDSERAARDAEAADRLALVTPHVPVKGRKVLEIGCATGEFCAALARAGASPVGVDLSSEAVALARSRHPGLDFRAAELTALPESERFDALFGWEVVEHVTSPRALFAAIAARLTPGGHVVLSTPNYACGRRVGADRWFGFRASFEHLYFFDADSLCRAAPTLELVARYTGGGNGLVVEESPLRTAARDAVRRLGLLDLVRRVRGRVTHQPLTYSANAADAHNLVVVLQARP
jgi:SAM-dependent methyltransferase